MITREEKNKNYLSTITDNIAIEMIIRTCYNSEAININNFR